MSYIRCDKRIVGLNAVHASVAVSQDRQRTLAALSVYTHQWSCQREHNMQWPRASGVSTQSWFAKSDAGCHTKALGESLSTDWNWLFEMQVSLEFIARLGWCQSTFVFL